MMGDTISNTRADFAETSTRAESFCSRPSNPEVAFMAVFIAAGAVLALIAAMLIL